MGHKFFKETDLDEMVFLIKFSTDFNEFSILIYSCSHLLSEEVYLLLLIKIFLRKKFNKTSLIFSKSKVYISEFRQNFIY